MLAKIQIVLFPQLAFDDGVLARYGLTTKDYKGGDFYGNRE